MSVHVDAAGKPGEHGERSKDGKCPKCGGKPFSGFGLAYGGYGPYEFCTTEGCDWFWKEVYEDDRE